LGCFTQAALILRWFLDGTRVAQMARDNAISKSTGYDYLNEGIDVLAAQAPTLHGALLAAKTAGYSRVTIDGTLIETDRVSTPGTHPRSRPLVERKARQPRRQRAGRHRSGGGRWRDHRQVINGILFRVRTGVPWRDIPERYGPHQTLYKRFARWEADGTWARIEAMLQTDADAAGDLGWDGHVDSTVVRAHQHAAGAAKGGSR
jgi:transposase